MEEKLKPNSSVERLMVLTSLSMVFPFYINVPILIFTCLVIFWTYRKHLVTAMREWTGIFLFIAYTAIVAIIRRNYIGASVSIAFAAFAFYFYFYRQWICAQKYLKLMLWYVLSSGVLAMLAIVKYLTYAYQNGYDWLYIFKYNNLQTRAEATFFNANYYGLFCLAMIICLLYLWHKAQTKKFRWLLLTLALLNFIAIILTASRWLWPTLIVCVSFFFIVMRPQRMIYLVIAGIAIISIIFINPKLLPRAESLTYAFEDRWGLWTTGVKLFQWHPWFGTGPMTFMSYFYLITDDGNMHAHNLLIDILANFGLVGTVFLLGVVLAFLSQYYPAMKDRRLRLEICFLSSLIVLILFHGIMDVAILWVQTGYIFLAFLMVPPSLLRELSELSIGQVIERPGEIFTRKFWE